MFLDDLNDSQREAVLCLDAPSLVIAGAGSGKTRVLTYKIAYLLQQGFKPWNILALTFTNKAAREMQQRISLQVGLEVASALWMGTFHSIFARILRIESSVLGFTSDFTIYDAADSKSLIKSIIKDMGLDDKKYKPGTVASHISMAKNRLILPSMYQRDGETMRRDAAANMKMIGEIYVHYWERCRKSNAMDFDDILVYTWILLSQNPEIAKKYEEKFHFVLVDEYQDTNFAQHQIVWLLTQHRQRVCVVGDDAQSIYSFRGANIDNILHFQELYQGSRLFKLEQNYRSTQTIVSAANSLIHHNRGQIHKDVFSKKNVGDKVSLLQTYSDVDEANAVLKCIRELHRNEQLPYSQIAILYRTNAQSRNFEEVLRKANIPYRIYGGLSFYQRKEIKNVIAYLRLVVNPYDEEALRRIINYPARGIGQTTLDKVFALAITTDSTPWDILNNVDSLSVNAGTKTKLSKFVTMINEFHSRQETDSADVLARDIIQLSGMQADINHGSDPDDIARQENLQELFDGISAMVEERKEEGRETHLTDYLQEISLLSDLDESKGEDTDRVTLMTVHAAKGLEFRAVFVVGMEEGLFPSQMSEESPRGLEEERRLFYVAMTRAEEFLVLTTARSRFRYGKTEFSAPSRFLSEIDSSFLHVGGVGASKSSNTQIPDTSSRRSNSYPLIPDTSSRSSNSNLHRLTSISRTSDLQHPTSSTNTGTSGNSSLSTGLSVGTRIIHDRFGEGSITAIEGSGIDTKATVAFDNVGTKQLLLRFAKFTIKS